jgi:hypothetical protein
VGNKALDWDREDDTQEGINNASAQFVNRLPKSMIYALRVGEECMCKRGLWNQCCDHPMSAPSLGISQSKFERFKQPYLREKLLKKKREIYSGSAIFFSIPSQQLSLWSQLRAIQAEWTARKATNLPACRQSSDTAKLENLRDSFIALRSFAVR